MDRINSPRPPPHEGLLVEIAAQLKAINLKLDAIAAPPVSTEYFTLEQVANKLHLSKSTIYRKIYSGEIIASKVGRRLYISESEFNKLFNN